MKGDFYDREVPMIKCPYCGKEFDEKDQPKEKWYFTNYWVVIALLCFGPLALPLVWFNPRYNPRTKWIVSILVIIITIISIWIYMILKAFLLNLMQQLQHQLGGIG
jgi:uncharacterized protein (DUF983 family)